MTHFQKIFRSVRLSIFRRTLTHTHTQTTHSVNSTLQHMKMELIKLDADTDLTHTQRDLNAVEVRAQKVG